MDFKSDSQYTRVVLKEFYTMSKCQGGGNTTIYLIILFILSFSVTPYILVEKISFSTYQQPIIFYYLLIKYNISLNISLQFELNTLSRSKGSVNTSFWHFHCTYCNLIYFKIPFSTPLKF